MPARIRLAQSLAPHAQAASVMETPMIEIKRPSLWYGEKAALKDVSMSVPKHRITAFIGPSGCGKTTLLRCLNRMNDLVDAVKATSRSGGRTFTTRLST